MSSIEAASLLTVLTLAVTTGCTDSPGSDGATKSIVASGSTATTQVTQSPQSVLDTALGEVRQSEAISYNSRTVTSVNNSVTTYDTSGVWDSQQPTWKSTVINEAPLSSGFSFTAKLRYVDARLYGSVSLNNYPSTGWMDLTHNHDPGYGLAPRWLRSGPMPTDINLLSLIEPTAVETVGATSVLSGTLPNRVGLEFLGLTSHMSEIGLGMYDQGQTTVRLTLDQAGFPVHLDILGSDVDLVSDKVPDYVKDELGASGYRADYAKTRNLPLIKEPADTL